MNVLIVHAHPEPRSFNGAMLRTAVEALGEAGHGVVVSDLYAMGFEPRSSRDNFTTTLDPDYLKLQLEERHASEHAGFAADVACEIEKLEAADLLIFQFPLWWFGLPAILKGWCDRVLVMGRIYGGGMIYDGGRFKGRRALCALTTGGPAAAYAGDGFNGDLLGILRPVHRGIFRFVGFDVLRPEIVYGPVRLDDAARAAALAAWAARLRDLEHEAPIEVGRYA